MASLDTQSTNGEKRGLGAYTPAASTAFGFADHTLKTWLCA